MRSIKVQPPRGVSVVLVCGMLFVALVNFSLVKHKETKALTYATKVPVNRAHGSIQIPHVSLFKDRNLDYTTDFVVRASNYSLVHRLPRAGTWLAYDSDGHGYNCINRAECPYIFSDEKYASLFILQDPNRRNLDKIRSKWYHRIKPIAQLYEKYATPECPSCVDVLIPTMPRKKQNGGIILDQLINFRAMNSYLASNGLNYRFRAKFVNVRPFNNPEFYWMRQFFHSEAIFLDAYSENHFKFSDYAKPWYRPWGQYPDPRYVQNAQKLIRQTADYISMLEVQDRTCNKFFLLLEDDFLLCSDPKSQPLFLRLLKETVAAYGLFRAIKISFGAGGLFLPCFILPDLLKFLKAYIGSWPVDALMASFLLDQNNANNLTHLPYMVYRFNLAQHMSSGKWASTLGRDPAFHSEVTFPKCAEDNTPNAGQLELERFPVACLQDRHGKKGDFAMVTCLNGKTLHHSKNVRCRRWFKEWDGSSCVYQTENLREKALHAIAVQNRLMIETM